MDLSLTALIALDVLAAAVGVVVAWLNSREFPSEAPPPRGRPGLILRPRVSYALAGGSWIALLVVFALAVIIVSWLTQGLTSVASILQMFFGATLGYTVGSRSKRS